VFTGGGNTKRLLPPHGLDYLRYTEKFGVLAPRGRYLAFGPSSWSLLCGDKSVARSISSGPDFRYGAASRLSIDFAMTVSRT